MRAAWLSSRATCSQRRPGLLCSRSARARASTPGGAEASVGRKADSASKVREADRDSVIKTRMF